MPPAPLPKNEEQRLAALDELKILDSVQSLALNALVRAAALGCDTPIAMVSLIGPDRVWVKAAHGLKQQEVPRDITFCGFTILGDELLEVPDTLADPRFADNPMVLDEELGIRFYAGVPLKLGQGSHVGTLCVMSRTPRRLDPRQNELLRALGDAVTQALEQWRSDRLLRETAKELRINQEFLELIGELAGVGGWSADLESKKMTWSLETYDIYGVPRGTVPDLLIDSRFFTPKAREHMDRLTKAVRPGEIFTFELPFTRADGEARWIRSMGTLIREPGKADRMVGASMDITDAHAVETHLAEKHELLRVTLQSIGDGVITTDLHGIVNWLNPVAERLTGWKTEEAMGRPLTEIFVIKDEITGQTVMNSVQACLEREEALLLDDYTVLISRQGEEYGVEDSAAPIRNEAGEIIGAVLIFRDVTKARRMSTEMNYRATHDALTGLLDRGEFERRLSALLASVQPDSMESAVLFIDLDQFKLVNDTCGHPAGDQLLVQVGKLLASHVRVSDSVARLGGDEFAILLDQCPLVDASQLAQRICDRMEAYRFVHGNQRFRVGASIGLAPVNRWTDPSAVLQAADACCYAAKMGGRNRVHLWSDSDRELNARHGEAKWAAKLETALDDDRFVLFGQRIHCFRPGQRGLHAEVLLRMVDTNGALLPPGAFLPAAERFHIASRIDRWVLSHALEWLDSLPNIEAVEMLAINISGQSVEDAAFQAWALAELATFGRRISERVCLEITETAAVTNLADASAFIDRLKAIGTRVALDDFGAGASSFGYLKSMAVDYLKIDGQFVRDILTDRLDEVAVQCFVQIAKVLGLQTIAEYTESAEVLEGLRAIGVDFAQGYFVQRPIPIEQLLAPAELAAPVEAA